MNETSDNRTGPSRDAVEALLEQAAPRPVPPAGVEQEIRAAVRDEWQSVTTANAVDWSDDTLVIGVADGVEAKAYSVTFLNRREMVIDEINGSPILVSW